MFFKILTILFIFFFSLGKSNIIYDKNDITVTNLEINNYIKLYKRNYGVDLNYNLALKNIVVMKNTINFLILNNPYFMEILDENLKKEFGDDILDEKILLNFLRFQKIRNEFISEYFNNEFNLNDLELIFSSLSDLNLPLSKNNCLTIDKMHKANQDLIFIENFLKNLKTNQKTFKTLVDGNIYSVCISSELYKSLEDTIIRYIENITEEDFNKFIYKKLN